MEEYIMDMDMEMDMVNSMEEEEMLRSFVEGSEIGIAAYPSKELISGALGGPLSFPDSVSPLVHIRSFQDSHISMLMALQAELNDPSIQLADDSDISVDDLKIISQEEFLNRALKTIIEENAKEATDGVSEARTEHDSSSNPETSKKRAKLKLKKGRPTDKCQRGDAWDIHVQNCHDSEGSLHERLRAEHEAAKANCRLLSLSIKKPGAADVCSERGDRIQTSNFFAYPVMIDKTTIGNAIEQVSPFEMVLWIDVRGRTKKQKDQGFLVLGSQMLTILRDKIYCLADELMRKANFYVPSGYFYIENTFYNDLRDPSAIDYSVPILDWLKKGPARTGIYAPNSCAVKMESTKFLDLKCRIGKRYLYCHQGNCKHVLVIRDMRIIHKDDIHNALFYPLIRTQFRLRHSKCTICQIHRARKVTYEDKKCPQSPCFFCEYCYYLLHYSEDGRLLYDDFHVYDYP